MGNWQLEVGRMILYISFPIGMFHYFNQRENIEEWLINERKRRCQPITKKQHDEFLQFIEDFQERRQLKQLQQMEEQYQKQKTEQNTL